MSCHQEIASDASYNGQIVVLTYPLIGNYGTFDRAAESRRPWVEALVVRELDNTCREGTLDLDTYLRQYGVPGIAGIDTRALVRRLRAKGTLRGALLQVPPHLAHDPGVAQEAIAKARASAPLAARPLVVDLRNIYGPSEMAAAGLSYVSLGRRSRQSASPSQTPAPSPLQQGHS